MYYHIAISLPAFTLGFLCRSDMPCLICRNDSLKQAFRGIGKDTYAFRKQFEIKGICGIALQQRSFHPLQNLTVTGLYGKHIVRHLDRSAVKIDFVCFPQLSLSTRNKDKGNRQESGCHISILMEC